MEEGEGTYVCTLDETTLKKAKDELNEDPKQRASQIETFREWVKEQPHISSRTDDGFLLRFLRIAKFDQIKAQQVLENFWTTRTVPGKGAPGWFNNMDPANPENQELMDLGIFFPLPGRDKIGRKVIYVNTGGYDPNTLSLDELFKIGFMSIDTLIQDEFTQIHGFVILLDFSDFTASHLFHWSLSVVQKASRCLKDTYPTRNKSINFYNTPSVFNTILDLFKTYIPEKLKDRLHFHKESLESLHNEIDVTMLPDELGGTAGTKEDLARQWKEELKQNRKEILLCSKKKYGVDESKRKSEESNGWAFFKGLFN